MSRCDENNMVGIIEVMEIVRHNEQYTNRIRKNTRPKERTTTNEGGENIGKIER